MTRESERRAAHCVPCTVGAPALGEAELQRLTDRLDGGWRVVDGHHLERELRFADFAHALAFTNAVGTLSEAEGHHPEIHLAWGVVRITLWTYKAGGLSENDFILAELIDRIASSATVSAKDITDE